jgi:hypothetical protein
LELNKEKLRPLRVLHRSRFHSVSERKAHGISERETERERVKKKKRRHFRNCAFLFSREEYRIIEPNLGGVGRN